METLKEYAELAKKTIETWPEWKRIGAGELSKEQILQKVLELLTGKTIKISEKDLPYIVSYKLTIEKKKEYNPQYGDLRGCKCGHVYERHFDSYENMAAVGCKYCGHCGCEGFEEETITEGDEVVIVSNVLTKGKRGFIVKNDAKEKDFKVSFDAGWQGYYNRDELRKV